jgi:hypothetical protein
LAEALGQKPLAREIIKRFLDMFVGNQVTDILKKASRVRNWRGRFRDGLSACFINLIDAIAPGILNNALLSTGPTNFDSQVGA